MELAAELRKVTGEIDELRHQYQGTDEALSKLLERDLVGGVVQLQLNPELDFDSEARLRVRLV